MSNDIYKAPDADLSNDSPSRLGSEFFIVSIRKLWIMNMVTMGSYLIVWNYLHWREHKTHNNLSIWPVPRTVFSIFYIYALLNLISDSFYEKTNKQWNPVPYVVAYIVLAFLGYALNFIPDDQGGLILASMVSSTVLFTYLLSRIQVRANEACSDIKGEKNQKLTGWNIFWIVVFGLFWLLMIFGAYVISAGLA